MFKVQGRGPVYGKDKCENAVTCEAKGGKTEVNHYKLVLEKTFIKAKVALYLLGSEARHT